MSDYLKNSLTLTGPVFIAQAAALDNYHYIYCVSLSKKILGQFLLAVYVLVVLHSSVAHTHDIELSDFAHEETHRHSGHSDLHHEHSFHVGIFHLLGHLFENIHHSNELADDHLVVVQKTSAKKVVKHNKTVNFFIEGNNRVVYSVDAESLPDPPPYHLFLLHRLKQPNTPLRAPPALV